MAHQDVCDDGVWRDLVVAMLAVGGFGVDRVEELSEALDQAGLLDPRNLATWDEGRVTRDLNAAGYSRGLLTGMYAERLVGAMRSLAENLEESREILCSNERDRVTNLLLPQYGIGPKVVETYVALRRRRRAPSE